MKNLFIALCLTLFVVSSCAEITVVDADGVPVKNHDIFLSSPSSGIETHFYIQEMVETSTDSLKPVFLNIFEKYNLKQKDVKSLFMVLSVKNVKTKRDFQLKKRILYREPWGDAMVTLSDATIYSGSDFNKTWQIALPVTQLGSYVATVRVDDDRNIPIAFYEFKYNIR